MDKALKLLKRYTRHEHIELCSRGNTAIFAGLYCARKLRLLKKKVIIPDQGGWLSYKKYPKMLELETVELKTDKGVIVPSILKKALAKNDVSCIIYQNPAGYFADQDAKEIYKICKGRCSVILDVSGSLGDPELCDGNYADFMVASFGKWKPVNLGYGGFISIKEEKDYERGKEIFQTTAFDDSYLSPLAEKLIGLPKRMDMFYKTCRKIKKDLKDFRIIHRDKKGINVIVAYDTEAEKQEIIAYCQKQGFEFTQCPRYIRVMEDAISIEVKRL